MINISFVHAPVHNEEVAHHAFYDSIHYKSHAMFFRFTDPCARAHLLDKDRNYSGTTLRLKNIYFSIFLSFFSFFFFFFFLSSTRTKLFDHRYYHFMLVISNSLHLRSRYNEGSIKTMFAHAFYFLEIQEKSANCQRIYWIENILQNVYKYEVISLKQSELAK